jgi:hypothetical protein
MEMEMEWKSTEYGSLEDGRNMVVYRLQPYHIVYLYSFPFPFYFYFHIYIYLQILTLCRTSGVTNSKKEIYRCMEWCMSKVKNYVLFDSRLLHIYIIIIINT